jgi:hypothetical protein
MTANPGLSRRKTAIPVYPKPKIIIYQDGKNRLPPAAYGTEIFEPARTEWAQQIAAASASAA